MDNIVRLLSCFTSLIILLTVSAPARADQGKDLFDKECASCHTLGGGDSGGPDLKGIAGKRPAAWLERVIAEPDKLTAEKDPVQAELVKKYGYEMPNLGISREDARKIIAYLKGKAPAASTPAAPAARTSVPPPAATPTAPAAAPATSAAPAPSEPPPVKVEPPVPVPELIASGKALFLGSQPFSKGGAPCTSCHVFSYPGMQSGNLAADLSGTYARMGDNGVRGVLKSLKFPIMKKIYADRQLTDEEINAVTAFLADSSTKKMSASNTFPLSGIGLFALLLVGLGIYKRRIK